MHIPDGYLNPATCAATYGVMIPIWIVAAKKTQKAAQTKQASFLALGASFSFTLMMFNFPVPGGSSGHAVGGAFLAILFGPWKAVSILSIVLAVQSLLFHDGGLTTLGADALSMACVLPFTAYGIYRLLSRKSSSAFRKALAGALGGYFGLTAASFVTALLLGLQPHGTSGYFPYPLSVTVPVMVGSHLLLFGWVEGLVTGAILLWIHQYFPEPESEEAAGFEKNHSVSRILRLSLLALLILSPLGILASGTAFGEWSSIQLKNLLGYLPEGFVKLNLPWRGIFPNYRIPGTTLLYGYAVSAGFGAAVVWIFTLLLGKMALREKSSGDYPSENLENAEKKPARKKELPHWLCAPEKSLPRIQKEKSSLIQKTMEGIQNFLSGLSQCEEYQQKQGFLQRRNSKIKLASLLALIFLSGWQRNFSFLIPLFLFSLVLAYSSKIPLRKFLPLFLLPMAGFSLLLMLPAMFSGISPGEPLIKIFHPLINSPPLNTRNFYFTLILTKPGVTKALLLTLRATTAFSYSALLALTTPWSRLLEALQMIRIPQGSLFIIEMSYRYIFLFLRLLEQMTFAKRARTIAPMSLSEEQRWASGRMAALFHRSLELSDNIAGAMIARGYTGKIRSYDGNQMDFWDKILGFAAAAAAVFALILSLKRSHAFSF